MKLNKLLLSIAVCFTPGDNCTKTIIDQINSAKTEILVEAYAFTDMNIASTIINAHKRGVRVSILIDKRNVGNHVYKALINDKESVKVDVVPGLAHNKIIIIDRNKVITGSFNFSKSAQAKNAENLLVTDDKSAVLKYLHQFQKREKTATPLNGLCMSCI